MVARPYSAGSAAAAWLARRGIDVVVVDGDPLEFVEIWNKMSGARISTYVLYGPAGSRCCILNGAAARTCQVGDEVIDGGVDVDSRHRDRDWLLPIAQ